MAKDPRPVRFSKRTEWYLEELVRIGVGLNRSEVVRRFVWDGIESYIDKGKLPFDAAPASDIPKSENPKDREP